MTTINNKRIQLEEQSVAPSTPTLGKVAFYAKTDGKLYYKDDAGVETLIGGGSGLSLISSGSLAGVATITISSIPATYNHLRLYVIGQSTDAGGGNLIIRFGNGSVDSGTNYYRTAIRVVNTSPTHASDVGSNHLLYVCSMGGNTNSTRYGFHIMDIPFYKSAYQKSAIYQHSLSDGVSPAGQIYVSGRGVWTNTAAIDYLGISITAGNFATGSEYILYGLD